MSVTAIWIRETDHVATLTTAVAAGQPVRITGQGTAREITALSDMPAGHKLAVCAIEAHQPILKYGEVIGEATEDIGPGAHVHVHNCRGIKARRFD